MPRYPAYFKEVANLAKQVTGHETDLLMQILDELQQAGQLTRDKSRDARAVVARLRPTPWPFEHTLIRAELWLQDDPIEEFVGRPRDVVPIAADWVLRCASGDVLADPSKQRRLPIHAQAVSGWISWTCDGTVDELGFSRLSSDPHAPTAIKLPIDVDEAAWQSTVRIHQDFRKVLAAQPQAQSFTVPVDEDDHAQWTEDDWGVLVPYGHISREELLSGHAELAATMTSYIDGEPDVITVRDPIQGAQYAAWELGVALGDPITYRADDHVDDLADGRLEFRWFRTYPTDFEYDLETNHV